MTSNSLHAVQVSRLTRAAEPTAPEAADANCADAAARYELRFRSLFDEGRGYAFPCDADGVVDLDALSEKARNSYFYAHTVIGRELSIPAVQRGPLH